MVYPVVPDVAFDYEAFQAGSPTTPLPANEIADDFADHKVAIDALIAFVKLFSRSDGALKNLVVTPDSLSAATLALMGSWLPRGDWVTATAYAVNDTVQTGGSTYLCIVAHTSGTFATDLAALKWVIVGAQGSNAYTATTAGFTMPAIHSTVTVAVGDAAWVSIGQIVYVATAGFMEVTATPTTTSVALRNIGASGNAAAAASIATTQDVSPAGSLGTAWYTGAGVPSALVGANGDLYLRSSDGVVYQKAAGAWASLGFNLIGPTGATGATGATGPAGAGAEGRTAIADTAYTALTTDNVVAFTSLTTNRTVTLPAAGTFTAGKRLVVVDESGSASQSVAISLAPNGSDTIAGSNTTQVAINISRGRIELECNGTNGWHVIGDWCVRYVAVMGADVSLNNTGTYFDTVSVAQGSVGTWRCMTKVTVTSGGIANVNGKLWDGTTVIDSGRDTVAGANQSHMITMLGDITTPAGNIKVSVNDASRTDGTAKYNYSGNSKDTSLIVWRIS